MNTASNSAKGVILILLSSLMFGSYGVWSKLLGTSQGIFYTGWTRSLLIVLVLVPILLYLKEIKQIARKDWGWLLLFLIFTSATQAPLLYAFNHMDIGSATLLFFVTMLLTMYIVGFLFLKERLTPIKAISFAVACAGMYTVYSFSIVAFSVAAALFAVLNGIASGGEVSFSKKLTGSYSALYLSWLSWIAVAVTNAIVSIMFGEIQHVPTLDVFWLYQLLYGAVSVLGFWAIMQGLKYTEASLGGLLGLLEIVFSIMFGMVLFHESLTVRVVLGAVLIIGAAALPHLAEVYKQKTPRLGAGEI